MIDGKPLILNVDDDEAGRYAVGRTLRQAGFEVQDAGTGQDGIHLAIANKPDLILLDIRLPDIDGFEVCRRIRAAPDIAGTPIIQMSASYLDINSHVKGLDSGADAYLTEPTEPSILVATVNSMLRLRRAEQKVIRAAQSWQSTFDSIRDGIAVLDLDGRIAQSNPTFRSIKGTEPGIAAAFARMRVTCSRTVEEVKIGDAYFVITLDPTFGETDNLTGAVCVVSDITEKKRLNDQLQQKARLESIGVLAGGIAHDFNNLLTGILGNASLVLDELPRSSELRVLMEEVVKASKSAADLTSQILAYSGKGRFVMKSLDLNAIAQDVRSFVKRLVPPQVVLSFEYQPDLPLILADKGQIQQVVMNLVTNAVESFPKDTPGQVQVSTDTLTLKSEFFGAAETNAPGEYVTLTVSDNGSGMDQQTLDRIFDPFFTTKFTGRGLGLSAVRGIVQGHSGVLRVKSQPGEGTTFQVYLPVAAPRFEPALPVPVNAEPVRQSYTVLIAEDEPSVRQFLSVALVRFGYRVLTAHDGQEAVEMFRKYGPSIDIVIMDFTMPVMNGEEASTHLLAMRPDVPIILSSGFSHETAAERFRGKPLAGFLGKPYTVQRLDDVVRSALARRVTES